MLTKTMNLLDFKDWDENQPMPKEAQKRFYSCLLLIEDLDTISEELLARRKAKILELLYEPFEVLL